MNAENWEELKEAYGSDFKPSIAPERNVLAAVVALKSDVVAINQYTYLSETPENTNRIFEGDSLTAPLTGGLNPAGAAYPEILMTLPGYAGRGNYYNFAVSGNQLAQVEARYTASVYPLRPLGAITTAYLHLWIGANDYMFGGGSAADFLTDLDSYVSTALTDGFKIILGTIMYSPLALDGVMGFPGRGITSEAWREEVNAGIRSWSSRLEVFDFDAELSSRFAPAKFHADGVHPNVDGNTQFADKISKVPPQSQAPLSLALPGSLIGLDVGGNIVAFPPDSGAVTSGAFRVVSPGDNAVIQLYSDRPTPAAGRMGSLSYNCKHSGGALSYGGGIYADATSVVEFAVSSTITLSYMDAGVARPAWQAGNAVGGLIFRAPMAGTTLGFANVKAGAIAGNPGIMLDHTDGTRVVVDNTGAKAFRVTRFDAADMIDVPMEIDTAGRPSFPFIPIKANDAAAVADATLKSGGFYTITGSTALHVKP